MKSKLFLVGLFIMILQTPQSFAEYLRPPARQLKHSLLNFDFEVQGYHSDANYTADGNFTDIYAENARTWIGFLDYKIGALYAPAKWVEFYPYTKAQTHYSYPYFLPFQMTSAGAILRHHISISSVIFSPEVDVSFPLDSQENNPRQIITSDGVLKVTPSFLLRVSFMESVSPFLKIGFQYKKGGLAGLLLWQLGISYYDHIWELGALVGGFRTVMGDREQNNPQNRHRLLDTYNSGSLKFYSVNPELIGASAWVDVRASKKTYLFVKYGLDFYGKNYAKSFLNFNLGVKHLLALKKSDKKYKKSLRRFREKRESTDDIFDDSQDAELMREIEKLQ